VITPLYPSFLKLAGRTVVVVGGGAVAAGRVAGLRDAGADVTVVAESLHADIAWSHVRVVRRSFRPSDLDGAWFAVAAATPEVNRAVSQAATERRVFVHAVDEPEHATAYAAGVLRRGGITIAVSTSGAAPALAGLLREGLEAVIPEDVASWVREARLLRRWQRTAGIPMAERRPLLLEALNRLYAGRSSAEAAS
jgi:siroheme synthase-like protein